MKKPERSSYTTLDFLQWQEAGTLVISPKFQRRGVWSRAAQSYLIDTMLLSLPIPPIYLRVVQSASRKGIVREVIDGQQRVSAVLSYVNDKFSLSKNIESACVGKRFSELKDYEKDAISQFSFVCEVFYGIEDQEILQVFSRLNTHSVKLNGQELRNGKYFGAFKQSVYGLALEHLESWRRNRIFTEQAIARMQEAELTSELVIAFIAGIQDKKKSIDGFYAKFDDDFLEKIIIEKRFRSVIDELTTIFSEDEIKETEFRRVPILYSLFLAVYHRMYGIPKEELATPSRGSLSREDRDGLQDAVRRLSTAIANAKSDEEDSAKTYTSFVNACLRQTDNLRPRETRFRTIYSNSFQLKCPEGCRGLI